MASITHPHKKQAFQERGEKRDINHHLENFHHVFSSWFLASMIGLYAFLGTSFLMEGYSAGATTIPSQVTNLRGEAYTGGVLLAWNQAISPSSSFPVYDYFIGYKLSTAKSYKLYADGISGTPNTRVEPLISGNSYDFRIAARSKKGLGAYSTTLRITIPADYISIPSAPIGVTAKAKVDSNPTTDSVTLSFVTPKNNGGLPIKNYTISLYPQTATNSTPTKLTKTITANSSLSTASSANLIKVSLTLTGLTNNTTYTFTVRATNSLGSSPESSPSSPIIVGKSNTTNTNTGTTGGTGGGSSGGSSSGASGGSSGGGTTPTPTPINTGTTTPTYTYAWTTGSYGNCSLTCGGGTQTRTVTCTRTNTSVTPNTTNTVADSLCITPKPTTSQACNTQACTPTNPTNQPPVATINTPASTSVSVTSGTAVNFAGSSVDPDGTIAAHEWRSDNCTTGTILSTVATWSKSDFPVGTTLVYFRSRDNSGAWSTNCQSRTITVAAPPVTTPPSVSSGTNFFEDSGFESGNSGFQANQNGTSVALTRTNPIAGSQSLIVGTLGYGDSVLWSGVDFSYYTNKRSNLLTISARIRSTVASTSQISLCGLVSYADGTGDTRCSEVSGNIGDKGIVTIDIPLSATKDLSQVRIGIFQVGSQALSGVMIDSVEVLLSGLTRQTAPIASPSPTPNPTTPSPPSSPTTPSYNPNGTASAPAGSLNGLRIDLSYVSQQSSQFIRFKALVDAAIAGDPDYGFEPQHAAYMYRITGDVRYCDYAITFVENCASSRYASANCGVAGAEAAIRAGNRAPVSGDSYLEVGPEIGSLALVYDWCGSRLTSAQKTRWENYANQAIYNVWNPSVASWGGVSYPWSGWSIDNPGNNYYYSFVEATMYWALATRNQNMLAYTRNKLQGLVDYYRVLSGGGSLEGTGYGAAHMRLFQIYQVWKDSTGEDLAGMSTHLDDSIRFWLHATTPNRAYYAPIGDLARSSFPDIFDYHRRIILEARRLSSTTVLQDIASWWLNHISVSQMSRRVDSQWDLLPAGTNTSTAPNESLSYFASGVGRIFARTTWDTNALWMTFVAGKYNESHAHQDQGSFDLANNAWLAVTNNIYTPSGIEQGTEYNNVVRFEQNGAIVPQRESTESVMTIHQLASNGEVDATANLTPAYGNNNAVSNWTRNMKFAQRKLTVTDAFTLGAGTRGIFQIHTPVQPVISGNTITAGTLKIRVLSPANPTINIVSLGRYRIDISGGTTGYIVELTDQ